MKVLFKHIIRFVLPLLLVIYLVPISNKLKYSGLKDDCINQGAWIYNRAYENQTPIDIAFLGSSHTLNGINDAYISKQLKPLIATNLGYCRLGRNLNYSLLKMINEKKAPKHVVLEILEHEDRYSHPIFPLVSETKDVLAPTLLFNRDYFSDVWVHTLYKIELIQDFFFHPPTPDLRTNTFAFGPLQDTIAPIKLDEIKVKRHQRKLNLSDHEKAFYNRFPISYIEKVHRICTDNNITLSFVYLPGYGVPYREEGLIDKYSKYGHVLLPPQDILNNKQYWADESHLNKAGGRAISVWIANAMQTVVTADRPIVLK